MPREILIFVFALTVLAACSAEQAATDAPMPATADITATAEPDATDPFANFDTSISIRALMNAVIQPNALEIWQAVRYVVTTDGVQEDVIPQTNEDWARLRTSAVTLIESGNALLVPNRVAENNEAEGEYPTYMYRSEEIKALLETQPESWRYYVQELQFSTQATLEAIEKRDILGLIEIGATINNACEGCHAEYWYRRER